MKSYFWLLLLPGCLLSCVSGKQSGVNSVTGPVAGKLGVTLPHEHVMVDFIGADQVNPNRYDPDEVFTRVLPYLQQLKQQGCQTLIECTPAYLGRDPALLKRLSQASGLTILTNTGYYGAVKGKYLPAHAFTETAAQLANRWIQEWEHGINGTGIRPGFIKIGIDAGPLSDVNQKLITAAALTHRQTGLTIAAHTGNGEAALAQIKILQQIGVAPSAFIWVHSQNEKNNQLHRQAGQLGAWISLDGIDTNNVNEYVQLLRELKAAGLLKQVLISHDAGWYHVGEPQGGIFRSYETIFTAFIPALKKAGFTKADIKQIMEINPRRAFKVQVRSL
jgi:phosphotriesterase-related protein